MTEATSDQLKAPTESASIDLNRRQRHWQVVSRLAPELWHFRKRISLAFGCLLLSKLANFGVPITLGIIVDRLNPQATTTALALPIMLIVGYGLLRFSGTLFNELRTGLFATASQQTSRAISRRVFKHLHQLSLRFHLDRQTGRLSRDLERGTRAINSLLSYLIFAILPTLVEFLIVTVYLSFALGFTFTLSIMVTVVVYFLFTWRVTHWRTQFRVRMNEMESKANTSSVDALLNYETVKYFNNEKFEEQRYDEHLKQWQAAAIRSQTTLAMLNVGQGTIIALGFIVVMFLAAGNVVSGQFTLGQFVMVTTLLMQLYIPLNFLGTIVREVNHGLLDMENMFALLDEPKEVIEKSGAVALSGERPTISFENVSFAYNDNRQILKNISFDIEEGATVAVVGPSGAGKSTLARLLFRFFDVTDGRICINGTDIRDLSLDSLRRAIGVVPQDTVLFNDTIGYNIGYGEPQGEADKIERATKLAYLDRFVDSLPDKYDTLVGERGLKVSGGEKQRIAIARTILKNPPILILDEATSALDSAAERAIQTALDNVADGRSALVISHRLSTVINADLIIVLEAGRIVERGTHRELLNRRGIYAKMWELQQEQEKDEDVGAYVA